MSAVGRRNRGTWLPGLPSAPPPDEANKTAEFEPVGTHPGYRRLRLGTAMLLHGMHRARAAGATHMTVPCLGAPGHPKARRLFCSVGFRELSRDGPLIKTKTAG
jgi:GNAT superfamily N-acetyltransferase